MATYTSSDETIESIAGVRFTTSARQRTEEEAALQRIQAVLAEGETLLPSNTTLPHLALVNVMTANAPTYAVITLWVPKEKEAGALELLHKEGFTRS